jgi:site-specific recombinase XerD
MLRHSCGFYIADRREDVRVMQDWLGHSNVQNTVRYTTLAPARFAGARAPDWREKGRGMPQHDADLLQ